jgi:hypothetical protein
MVDSLASADARNLMLAILAEEVEIRVAAIARLAAAANHLKGAITPARSPKYADF